MRVPVVWIALLLAALLAFSSSGCVEQPPKYGVERPVSLPGPQREVWAVAPAINLSGSGEVDPLLQADLVYQQLQQVRGLTVIPVNRVAEVYAALRLDKVQTEEQAALVCDLLGADGLIVPTVTAFDPYAPPKFGASIQLFGRPGQWSRPPNLDPRQLARQATPGDTESLPRGKSGLNPDDPRDGSAVQSVGMFDAANGSVREAVLAYAVGRNDPLGPMGPKEYFQSMDRYCGFVYHELIVDVLSRSHERRPPG